MAAQRDPSNSAEYSAVPDETPAAQYIRMSTDHQRYSTENQSDAIYRYAQQHHMTIVRTYSDEGRSGLSFDGRDALKRLIDDVQQGNAPFKSILVYDVSRWGRFQDADESAYYEYICKRAGIQLIYCAEQFANDGSMPATVMKNLKRVMAGEYSRELSTKVFIGQCRLIELGFRQGGPAGFGLRRLLVNAERQPKSQLTRGEHKSLQTDRVILIPGPEDEIAIVQQIYQWFVVNLHTEMQIAEKLNQTGIATDLGRPWTRSVVHQILTNEKYIGNNVFNRVSYKLKIKRVRNTPDKWVRADHAFEGIVDPDYFAQAQAIITARSKHLDDAEMLGLLNKVLTTNGVLSGVLIDEQEGMPSSQCYRHRFGSLLRAYTLIGYEPERDYRFIEINKALRRMVPQVVTDIRAGLLAVNATVHDYLPSDLLLVNEEFSLSIVISRCCETASGAYRWRVRFDTSLAPDLTVVVRMDATNQRPLDYFLFPKIDLPLSAIRLGEENSLSLDAYRFDSLDALYALSQRTSLMEAA
jgi:DNA invertase Pin-like site-specific DNA recombinase